MLLKYINATGTLVYGDCAGLVTRSGIAFVVQEDRVVGEVLMLGESVRLAARLNPSLEHDKAVEAAKRRVFNALRIEAAARRAEAGEPQPTIAECRAETQRLEGKPEHPWDRGELL